MSNRRKWQDDELELKLLEVTEDPSYRQRSKRPSAEPRPALEEGRATKSARPRRTLH